MECERYNEKAWNISLRILDSSWRLWCAIEGFKQGLDPRFVVQDYSGYNLKNESSQGEIWGRELQGGCGKNLRQGIRGWWYLPGNEGPKTEKYPSDTRNTEREPGKAEFTSVFCHHQPVVWSWANNLNSLNLTSFICKMRILPTSLSRFHYYMK